MDKTSNRLAVIVLSAGAVFWTSTLVGGCSSDGHQHPSDAGTGDARADGNTTPVDGVIPDTAAGRALAWVVDVVNGNMVTEAEVNQRFNAAFLAQVPAPQLIEVLTEFGAMKPLKVESLEGASTANALTAVVTSADSRYWRLQIGVDGSGKIAGLLLTIAGDLDPTLKSWAAITERAVAVAPQVNLLAATLDDQGCVPIHAVAADSSLAIGSTFKLWVLAALAEQIRAGTHSWTETMPIDDARKSLPTGVLQDQPAGTQLALSIFASQMISISDNTAADHLLFLLGREAVEAMLPLTGHHAPAENQPFLSTRELFTLKLLATSAEQAAYTSGTTEQKRALLTQYDAVYDPRTYSGPDWTTPRMIDRLEWFASPSDSSPGHALPPHHR